MGVDSKIGCGAGNGLLMVEELQDGDASVLGCQRNQAIGIMTGFLCVRHLSAWRNQRKGPGEAYLLEVIG
jgi:hypothetical protein